MARTKNYSAATARHQVPALFRTVEWQRGTRNADIGGGPWDLGTQYLASCGVTSLISDPGNRAPSHNAAVIRSLRCEPPDTATISNVLNVIQSPRERSDVIALAASLLQRDGVAYFSVYGGNRSGCGGPTRDGWQENRALRTYVDEVKRSFGDVRLVGKMIVATTPRRRRGCQTPR